MELNSNNDFLLFELYFDLKGLLPNVENWNEEYLEGNPPRMYRFLMIQSCLKRCNINLEEFTSGSFLNESDIELYHLIELKLKEAGLDDFLIEFDTSTNHLDLIRFMYKRLFEFRFDLQQIYTFNSGVLMTSSERMLSLDIIENVIQKIRTEVVLIDELLIILFNGIDNVRKLDKLNLICDFDFPMVDLNEIDGEWI